MIKVLGFLLTAALSFVVGVLLEPVVWLVDIPLAREIYQGRATVTLQSPPEGGRERLVSTTTGIVQMPGRQFVLWTTRESGGAPDHAHVYPYNTPQRNQTRSYTVRAGGERSDVGNSFFVQLCDVGGEALKEVERYLNEKGQGSAPQDDRAVRGLDLSNFRGDFYCSDEGTKQLFRTVL